jgi:hypothetical protein
VITRTRRGLCLSVIAASLIGASLVAAGSSLAAPLAPAAAADAVTIPPGSPDPWSDPSHRSPLEQLASTIAAQIIGRPVAVRCEDQTTWNQLNPGSDASDVLGFVMDPPDSTTTRITKYRYVWKVRIVHGKRHRYRTKVPYTTVVTHADLFTQSANTIELSPQVCGPLQQFAEQSTKPTKCAPNGAPVPCFIGMPTTQFPGLCTDSTLTTCYSTADDWPDDYYNAYDGYAQALLTLAHESIHVIQGTEGKTVPPDALVESQAECSGLQWMAQVAVQFGDSPDDAQQIADYTWLLVYPNKATLTDAYSMQHPYWSADCKPGGALDVRPPGSTVWP